MDALMDFSREKYDRFLSLAYDQHIQIMRAMGRQYARPHFLFAGGI